MSDGVVDKFSGKIVEKIMGELSSHYDLFKNRFKQVKDLLTGKTSYSLQIEEVKNIIELLKHYNELEIELNKNPRLSEIPVIKDFLDKALPDISKFFKENPIIYENGKYSIVTPEIGKYLIDKAKEEKTKETEEKINIVPINKIEIFDDYRNEEKTDKEPIIAIVKKLGTEYLSLVSLSIYVEKLYKQKREEDAEEVKYSIFKRYDKFGSRFCNLYIRGYLKNLFISIYERQQKYNQTIIKEVIDKEIREFIDKKAENIFFIHPYMTRSYIETVVIEIKIALTTKKDYVAVHSLGFNKELAKKIVEEIGSLGEGLYNIKIVDEKIGEMPWEFSKIWYKGEEGEKIYLLVR